MSYYTGDNIPLEFTIWQSSTPKTPSAATVVILKPDRSSTNSANATIVTNTVSYSVPTSVTTLEGIYTATFTLTIDGNTRSKKMRFTVEA